jgi:ATP/maltotriose-dependent transcriptional regulator MalT
MLEKLLFGVKVGWPYLTERSLHNLHQAATILIGEGDNDRAYELLGTIEQQRHRFDVRKDHPLLSLLRLLDEDLPPHLAAAVARGRERELDRVVKEVIADLSASVDSAAALPSLPPQSFGESFGERELEILRLLADGLNSREVAERLHLGVSTIRWYLKHIYGKLDAHSRSEAIARARELKLLA